MRSFPPPVSLRTSLILSLTAVLPFIPARPVQAHGDLDVRIAQLTDKLTAEPSNATLWLERADVRRQHGENAAAHSDADQAAGLRPDWAAPQLQLARIQFAQNLFSDAQISAEAALRLEPDNADARVLRARCLVRFARTNDGIANLTHVLTGSATALPDLYLERAAWQAEGGDFAGAVKGLDEGIRKLGNTPSLALPAIEYERQSGMFSAALARLDSVKRYLPRTSAMLLRGEVLADAGRTLEARIAYETALAELPPSEEQQSNGTHHSEALRTQLRQALQRLEGNLHGQNAVKNSN